MLSVQVICIGKLKERFYLDAVEEYTKRLSRHCRLTVLELPETKLPDHPSAAQIAAALSKEADLITARIQKGSTVVAMCIEGEQLSSEQLAQKFSALTVGGASQLCFLIGGSFGMDPSLKAKSDFRLSMSRMTFPHHLARVMLLEQIYRAFQINDGTRYHK